MVCASVGPTPPHRFARLLVSACKPARAPLNCIGPKRLGLTRRRRVFKLIPPQNIRSIPESEITIGERLRSSGYATAHYGKWHISAGGPQRHGYDESDGDTGNGDAAPHKGDNPVDIFGMGRRAAAFMEKSHEAGKPFFIQMSYHALHYPENAKPETVAKYLKLLPRSNEKAIGRAALAENLDEGIGLLLQRLDELGLSRENLCLLHVRQRWWWDSRIIRSPSEWRQGGCTRRRDPRSFHR